MPAASLEHVANLAKRRGFIVQSSELYGGAAAAYDYGPLGVELKNNLKRLWWEEMTRQHENIVGLDAAIFMHPKVWEASGHVESFTDPLVECPKCHRRFRADGFRADAEPFAGRWQGLLGKKENAYFPGGFSAPCPACGSVELFRPPRQFNLMFRTHLGPTEDTGSTVYLRPETAQGIYVDAPYIQQVMRLKLPFGIAQIGKAFRNEITPGPFIFRTVEFEQGEMQFFVRPHEADRWFQYWREERMRWYRDVLEFPSSALRFHPHEKGELAHYAKAAADVQYTFPKGDVAPRPIRSTQGHPERLEGRQARGHSTRGSRLPRARPELEEGRVEWQEIEGIHNRGDWDMRRHQQYSGKDLTIFDEETKEKALPWIIETSAGVDRVILALLVQAYTEETVEEPGAAGRGVGEPRTVLKLPRRVAPIHVAVFPLIAKHEKLVATARELTRSLRGHFVVQYDDAGAIGRRYRRQDEVGTPVCVTVDHETLKDRTVTVRDRDTMKQERHALDELPVWLERLYQPTAP